MSFFLRVAPISALAVTLGLALDAGCIASPVDSGGLGLAAQAVTCPTISAGSLTLPNPHCPDPDAGAAVAAVAAEDPAFALGYYDSPYSAFGAYGGLGSPYGSYGDTLGGYYGGYGYGYGYGYGSPYGYGYGYGSPFGYGYGSYSSYLEELESETSPCGCAGAGGSSG